MKKQLYAYATPVAIGILSLFAQSINAFDVPYPEFRFREYNKLTADEKEAAAVLGYDEESWNQPKWPGEEGPVNALALTWWNNVKEDFFDYDGDGDYYEENPNFIKAAATLGFTEDVWDCWINHYDYYSWDDLVEFRFDSFYKELGWTADKWSGSDTVLPDTDGKSFAELSAEEKTAAVNVCYTQKLWDEEMLSLCVDSPRPILLNGQERSCDWVSDDLARCDLKRGEFSKHCPNTCGTCDINECVQTNLRVLWDMKDEKKIFKKCVRGLKTEKKKQRLCTEKWVGETCPETCALDKCSSQ